MFYSILPAARISLISCSVIHCSLAISLVCFVVSLIFTTVWPSVYTVSWFYAFDPLSVIFFTIFASELASTLNFIGPELSLIDIPIRCIVNPSPIPLIIQKLANVPASISIRSLAYTIGHVILPLPLISVFYCVIDIFSMAVRFVFLDLAFIIAAIWFYYATLAFASAINECPFKIVIILKV